MWRGSEWLRIAVRDHECEGAMGSVCRLREGLGGVDVYVTSESISLVFLIYCNPMSIPGCTWVMSCPDVPIGKVYNVNKSCQVIVGNPPIV